MKLCLGLAVIAAMLVPGVAAARNAVPISAITVIDPERDRREAKLKRKFCHRAKAAKGRPERLLPLRKEEPSREQELAMLLRSGDSGCPKDIDLAIAMVRSDQTVAEIVNGWSTFIRLEAAFRRERGLPEDMARADEITRSLWLRDAPTYPGAQPNWTDQERLEFLERDDVWAVLGDKVHFNWRRWSLRHDLMLNPQSRRFAPALAVDELAGSNFVDDPLRAVGILLEGKLVPADVPRAEALLWKTAGYYDPAMVMLLDRIAPRWTTERAAFTAELRKADQSPQRGPDLAARLVALVSPGLDTPDPQVQADSAALLLRYWSTTGGAQAPLLGWLDRKLTARRDPVRESALPILAALVAQGSAPARAMLDRELARSPLIDVGLLTPNPAKPVPLQKLVTENDYPTRAMREEMEGVVTGTAIIGPDGRVVLVEIAGSPDPLFAKTVSGLIQRRLRRPYPEHPGRYVRVQLPPVQFRLPECMTDEAPTAAVPGAILVEAQCRQQPVYDRVIY